jgi:predicted TIM-barrel fold metal-dependent hydrolase
VFGDGGGTDWPWFDPLLAIEQIESLGLSEEEKRRILGLNAAKVFGLRIGDGEFRN